MTCFDCIRRVYKASDASGSSDDTSMFVEVDVLALQVLLPTTVHVPGITLQAGNHSGNSYSVTSGGPMD